MMALPGINKQVLKIAHTWLGTPYRHQAAIKGSGCDCIGLITGIWLDVLNQMPAGFVMPPYTAWWAEETGLSLMVDNGFKYMIPIRVEDKMPGDILMYRMLRRGQTKHAGIYAGNNEMIHAYAGHNVMKTALVNNIGAKLTHVFRYPTEVK